MGLDEEQYYDSIQKCDIPERSSLYTKELERYKSALTCALDVRKFEIEMYWKRAQYFLTFISVIYGAYFYSLKDLKDKVPLAPFLLMVLAIFFSCSWFFVIKGSKFWQNNWERHVDLLENIVHGPIYKTIIFERKSSDLLSASPYSVSKINQLLSIALITISIALAIREAILLVFPTMTNVDIWFLLPILVGYSAFFIRKMFNETKSTLGENFSNEYYNTNKSKTGIIKRKIEIE